MQSYEEKLPMPRLLLHKQFIRKNSQQNEATTESNMNSLTSEETFDSFNQPVDLSFAKEKVIDLSNRKLTMNTSFKNSSNAGLIFDSSIFEPFKKNEVVKQTQSLNGYINETFLKVKHNGNTEVHSEPLLKEKYENSFPIDLSLVCDVTKATPVLNSLLQKNHRPEIRTTSAEPKLNSSRTSTKTLGKIKHCRLCNFKTNNQKLYQKHINAVHKEGMLYKCAVCGYKGRNVSKMVEHMRTHTGERPFKCDQCNYAAKRKDNLVQHKVVRHRKYSNFQFFSASSAFVPVSNLGGFPVDAEQDYFLCSSNTLPVIKFS